MRPMLVALLAVAGTAAAMTAMAFATTRSGTNPASPIYGVTLPEGYRQWELIAPAEEAAPLDELRVVVGNAVAIKAYREGSLPFPDGSVLVKLAWKRTPSAEFASATFPAPPPRCR
ncbi:Cytochrome P460 [Dyella jiangningensis]|nr:cytochrome P460 [Dyella sp. AtDHG13]SDJ40050.1 Cytochrome P460 [Dyella jiangningensis]